MGDQDKSNESDSKPMESAQLQPKKEPGAIKTESDPKPTTSPNPKQKDEIKKEVLEANEEELEEDLEEEDFPEGESERKKDPLKTEVKHEGEQTSSAASGSAASPSSQAEDGTAGLAEFIAATQMTAQMNALASQANQLAMASQLMNLPGYNQAYLQAALSSGKPLANMLSMALLQQQQQQATTAAVLAAAQQQLPKRGRGSRGGGMGRPRGVSMAQKLKRLES